MNRVPLLFAGIFATFAFAWIGVAMIPEYQLGNLQPQVDEEAGDVYPIEAGGIVDQGRRVYAANGCFYCHSQQVRDKHSGADQEWGWGTRRSVARDYLYETPVELGSMRNGPDLTNIGTRQKSADWHYLHLYNPRGLGRDSEDSIMPSFRFLFTKRKITGQRADNALNLVGKDAVEDGYEVVPTPQAVSLVGYLLSLDKEHALKETKNAEAPAK